MTIYVIIALWVTTAVLLVLATRRRIISHRNLCDELAKLESTFKEFASRYDRLIRGLELQPDNADRDPDPVDELWFVRTTTLHNFLEPTCILRQSRRPMTAISLYTGQSWGSNVITKIPDRFLHIRSSEDIARLWQDEEEYEKLAS